MNHVIDYLERYFKAERLRIKRLDIIKIEIRECDVQLEIDIYTRQVGILIGKNGWRCEDMETELSKYANKKVIIQIYEHTEWNYKK